MTWIRSPLWDCFWFLSAPLLALGMMFVPFPLGLLLMVQLAHTVSPIALAWSHRDYRRVMLARPRKFIGAPVLVMVVAVVVGVATVILFPRFVPKQIMLENLALDWSRVTIPAAIWLNVYAAWNLYHAGAQNFGFLCLYLRRGFRGKWRWVILGGSVVIAVLIGHEVPRIGIWRLTMFTAGLLFVNHWFAAIGLAAHVHAEHRGCSPLWFVGGALILGFAISCGFHYLWAASIAGAVFAASTRAGLGIWHFLQDKWLWQLSNPQVRATIGRNLFKQPKLRLVA